ncbi:DNA-binding protein [Desulfuribacillus stibiiarsenatis]|uniref:DNA-binding protein n=1 Tax=Desulfuribacillus stibiiarsenatis TaxID=1390249 RepID=A0A1E5L9Q2_9FIRM|nr:nuclear transport factor 2 family protein [Desulfuribacillus stibiiarsenatis]OEH86872.1 DNA-binding protein [Desulfuribacillus stibiiarsenatis]
MLKLIIEADCGNSPEKVFLKEFNIAFAKGDSSFIIDNVSEDITWNFIGNMLIQGKDELAKAFEDMKNDIIEEFTINSIIADGTEGAVNGLLKMEDGRIIAFCDIYKFCSAKGSCIKSITSYVIEIKE